MPNVDTALARYRPRSSYLPQIGDYLVWSGWITQWHGLVIGIDQRRNELRVLFAGVPYLLFNMPDEERDRNTRRLDLDEIKAATQGKYAILKIEEGVWYV